MNTYLIGNLIGRFVVSYLIVWVVMLLTARFNWRLAFTRSHRWYGLFAVVVVFLLGVSVAMSRGGLA